MDGWAIRETDSDRAQRDGGSAPVMTATPPLSVERSGWALFWAYISFGLARMISPGDDIAETVVRVGTKPAA